MALPTRRTSSDSSGATNKPKTLGNVPVLVDSFDPNQNRIEGTNRLKLAQMQTNADGRTDAPILPKGQFATGTYELVFEAGAYLDRIGAPAEDPRFLDEIPLRFGISDGDAHYHVPLLLSPFGYSTYRGS